MDQETQLLFSDVKDLSFAAWQERFSKCIINRELSEKQILPAPGAGGRIEYYKVYRKIAKGGGLVAYALSPVGSDSTLKPFLFFRPTQCALSHKDAIETYMNDIEPNIGQMGYTDAQSALCELMNDPKFCSVNRKIEVAGYSLGGVHAQRFLADHWRKVSTATFYNDPSIDSEVANRFAEEINQQPEFSDPLQLVIFRTKGDIADYVGEKHLGYGVTHPNVAIQLLEFDQENRAISLHQLHSLRIFDNPYRSYCINACPPQDFNTHLDNEQRGPAIFWYEKMRRCWGTVFFWLLFGLREITKFFCAFIGIELLRSSRSDY